MFERRPVFGVLFGLALIVTVWHVFYQNIAMYQDSAQFIPPPLVTPVPLVAQPQLLGIMHANLTLPAWLSVATIVMAPPSATTGNAGNALAAADLMPFPSTAHPTPSPPPPPPPPPSPITLVNPVETLPNDDYTSLIDLKDFKFIINFSNCSGRSGSGNGSGNRSADGLGSSSTASDSLKSDNRQSPLVLILVHSAPNNWYKRNTIRDTWGRYDPRAKLIFLLGAVNSTNVQQRIERESRIYDDIVQGSFVDAYRNMTYKHVMALKWFTYHCPDARYVLKTDDDVFINTPILYDVLEVVPPHPRLLLCQLATKDSVKRTHRSKWYVSVREYAPRYYPSHCPGYSIMYSPDVAFELYREAQQQPFFWIDDVHITGTVANRINVTITPMDGLYLDDEQKRNIYEHKLNATEVTFFFTNPNLPAREIRKLWSAVSPTAKPSR